MTPLRAPWTDPNPRDHAAEQRPQHLAIPDLWLTSTSGRPRLRIGLMLDGLTLTRWQREILEQIARSNHSAVVFLCMNGLAESAPRRTMSDRIRRLARDAAARRQFLFAGYGRVDARLFRSIVGPNPLEPVDCTDLLDGIPRMTATPEVKGFTHRFAAADVERLKAQELDVILRWGYNIIRGDVLGAARHGVWSYHHGDNDLYRGGPAGFWELVERTPVTGVLLQRLSEELDGGQVLVKGHVSTRGSVSLFVNRFEQYWLGSTFVLEKLYDLHQHGPELVEQKTVPNRFHGKRKIYRTPTLGETARFLLTNGPREAWKRVRRPVSSHVWHWRIALRASPDGIDPLAASPDLRGFRWVESPRGHFWADPFLVERDGTHWLFFEDYLYGEQRGVISVARLDDEGGIESVETALDTGGHLSYPLVFEDDGETYMMPESSGTGTIPLFRAAEFPRRWEKVADLAEGIAAVDTTVLRHEGRWWFFVTAQGRRDSGSRLLLFHAESLTGPWTHHPLSPVSSDVRDARSAGAIFTSGGRLIRPVQDCGGGYGRAVRFQEITRLTPDDYAAETRLTIQPGAIPGAPRRLEGIHTYNRAGKLEVIDGVRMERRSRHGA